MGQALGKQSGVVQDPTSLRNSYNFKIIRTIHFHNCPFTVWSTIDHWNHGKQDFKGEVCWAIFWVRNLDINSVKRREVIFILLWLMSSQISVCVSGSVASEPVVRRRLFTLRCSGSRLKGAYGDLIYTPNTCPHALSYYSWQTFLELSVTRLHWHSLLLILPLGQAPSGSPVWVCG